MAGDQVNFVTKGWRVLAARAALSALVCAAASFPARAGGPNGHVMIEIPAGKFRLGEANNSANPLREVRLAAFRIADAETTNAQFARFIEATGYRTDAEKRGFAMVFREGMLDWEWEKVKGACWRWPFGPGVRWVEERPEHPVTQISSADAEAYCKWLGGRLPTLDEWEAAARAGSTARYPWGGKFDPKKANVWNGKDHRKNEMTDGYLYTAPVRSFPPNAWGLYDVIGNVFEYCSGLPASSAGKKGLASARGGSWWCSASTCNSFNLVDIGVMDAHASFNNQGFRFAMGK